MSDPNLNLAAAADVTLTYAERAEQYAMYGAAVEVWEALTGLTGQPALDYARTVTQGSIRATVVPF